MQRTMGAGAMHGLHDTEEFLRTDGRIVVGLRVATRDEPNVIAVRDAANHTVGDETAVAREHHDVAEFDAGEACAVNGNGIAGPKGRQHAGTPDAQSQRRAAGDGTAAQGRSCRKRTHSSCSGADAAAPRMAITAAAVKTFRSAKH